jgi:hypothetical protein
MSKKILFCILPVACCTLLFSACGRRGDPVPVMPRTDTAVHAVHEDVKKKPDDVSKGQEDTGQTARPPAPTALRGLYTQTSVVLTWNEVPGQDIRYRVYRSTGDSYTLAGETATPAFTDKNVEPDKEYHYRISAVSASEGPPSEEIIIVTEIR